jgi:hypothetical protein
MCKDIRTEDYWICYYEENNFDFGYEEACVDISIEIGKLLKDKGINDFKIVDGYILLPNEKYPTHHVWLAFNNGNIIDVCCINWFKVNSTELKRVDSYHSIFHRNGSEEFFVTNEYSLDEYSKHVKWLQNGAQIEIF